MRPLDELKEHFHAREQAAKDAAQAEADKTPDLVNHADLVALVKAARMASRYATEYVHVELDAALDAALEPFKEVT